MVATDSFELHPPTKQDLDAAYVAWRKGAIRHDIAAGAKFWRTLRAPSKAQALEFAKACFPSADLTRFAPLTNTAGVIPSAYAANTEVASLWEVALRSIRHEGVKRVPMKDVRGRYLVQTRTTRDLLKLLDLRRPAISNVVSEGRRPPDLTAAWPCAYGGTRIWAQALRDRILEIDGFLYESHQISGECIVLFQIDDTEVFESIGDAHPLNEEPVRSILNRDANKAGAVVDFGDSGD